MFSDMTDWTLDRVLKHRAESTPGRTFLEVVGDRAETYAETFEAARTLAFGLEREGVEKGQTVVIMAPNSFEVVHGWIAVNMLGAIDVTINTALRGQLLEHNLNNSKARVMLIDEQFLPVLRDSEERVPQLEKAIHFRTHGATYEHPPPRFERIALVPLARLGQDGAPLSLGRAAFHDLASVIYTSGTTGPAKGVMMPHAQVYLLARHSVEGLGLGETDVFYCFHPLFHMAGRFMAVYATMLAGAKLVLDKRFEAEHWLTRARKCGATVGMAHGPMIEMMFAQPERPDDAETPMWRMMACPLPRRIAQDFERRFGLRGIEVWGMTEVNVPCWRRLDEPLRVGACGKVLEDWFELAIVDPDTDRPLDAGEIGEIVVRSKPPWGIMQGYLGMPEKTVEAWRNFWFHTGDAAYIDEGGYVYFVDRMKDRIRRRAENISPYDIETIALAHPGVAECAVVGIPSEFESDDDIKLCVVVAPGATPDPEALIEYLVARLPHYMVPRYIETLERLPRTPTNKVKKAELRVLGVTESTWDRHAAGVSIRRLAEKVTATRAGR